MNNIELITSCMLELNRRVGEETEKILGKVVATDEEIDKYGIREIREDKQQSDWKFKGDLVLRDMTVNPLGIPMFVLIEVNNG